MAHPEEQYLRILRSILAEGDVREGRNAVVRSLFGECLTFDLALDGFPLFTTKRVFWRGIVEELLWFLKGSTDAHLLAGKGVHIWDGNTTVDFLAAHGLSYPEGEAGPIYGWQMRSFNAPFQAGQPLALRKGGVDQVRFVLEELHARPTSRRAVMNLWNPCQLSEMCLPPCHTQYVFHRSPKGLCCMMTMRGADVCAGLPFNVASTALMLALFAHLLHTPTDRILIAVADAHIYEVHVEGARIQAERVPLPFPKVRITRPAPPLDAPTDARLAWLESLLATDIVLEGYECGAPISYVMVA